MRREKTCYICVKTAANTNDHVVPKSLFSEPYPNNLYTLPAHYGCHSHFDEEYLRIITAGLGLEVNNRTAQTLWDGKIRRSIQKNDALRKRTKTALRQHVNLVSPAGIWLGSTAGIQFDPERVYPIFEKIVRGLYFKHTKGFLTNQPIFRWVILNEPPLDEMMVIFRMSLPGLTYPGVFECKYGIASDREREGSVWWLRFYERVVICCIVMINKVG